MRRENRKTLSFVFHSPRAAPGAEADGVSAAPDDENEQQKNNHSDPYGDRSFPAVFESLLIPIGSANPATGSVFEVRPPRQEGRNDDEDNSAGNKHAVSHLDRLIFSPFEWPLSESNRYALTGNGF